jgi:hypothetical protein
MIDCDAFSEQSLRRARSNLVTTNTIAGLPAQSGGEEPGCVTGKTGSKGKPVLDSKPKLKDIAGFPRAPGFLWRFALVRRSGCCLFDPRLSMMTVALSLPLPKQC